LHIVDSTSDYLPLFGEFFFMHLFIYLLFVLFKGIFYLSIIMIIFAGTLITAFVLNVHLQALFIGNNLNPLNL